MKLQETVRDLAFPPSLTQQVFDDGFGNSRIRHVRVRCMFALTYRLLPLCGDRYIWIILG